MLAPDMLFYYYATYMTFRSGLQSGFLLIPKNHLVNQISAPCGSGVNYNKKVTIHMFGLLFTCFHSAQAPDDPVNRTLASTVLDYN